MTQGVTRKVHTWNKECDRDLLIAVQMYGVNDWSSGKHKPIRTMFTDSFSSQLLAEFPRMLLLINAKKDTLTTWRLQ